ncbi:MAG: hypothetical protein ACKOC4_01345, partial [Planctomycetia bacterium]
MASPAAPQTPIQRLVASRAVRSGYTSAVVHLVALIGLALFWIDGREPPRPRPIFIAFADAADPGAEPAAMAGAAAAEAVMPGPPAAPEPAVADTTVADAAPPEPAVAPDPAAREPEPLVPVPPATVGVVAARPVA